MNEFILLALVLGLIVATFLMARRQGSNKGLWVSGLTGAVLAAAWLSWRLNVGEVTTQPYTAAAVAPLDPVFVPHEATAESAASASPAPSGGGGANASGTDASAPNSEAGPALDAPQQPVTSADQPPPPSPVTQSSDSSASAGLGGSTEEPKPSGSTAASQGPSGYDGSKEASTASTASASTSASASPVTPAPVDSAGTAAGSESPASIDSSVRYSSSEIYSTDSSTASASTAESASTASSTASSDTPTTAVTPIAFPIDSVLRELAVANMVFQRPPSMLRGESKTVNLLISRVATVAELTRQVEREGEKVEGHQIRIAPIMQAHLSGSSFEITPVTPEEQPISGSETSEWRWEIKPKEFGQLRLHLVVSAVVTIEGRPLSRTLRTFEETVIVNVSWTESTLAFFGEHIEWVMTGVLVPVVTWAITRWRKRRKQVVKPRPVRPPGGGFPTPRIPRGFRRLGRPH